MSVFDRRPLRTWVTCGVKRKKLILIHIVLKDWNILKKKVVDQFGYSYKEQDTEFGVKMIGSNEVKLTPRFLTSRNWL